MNIINYVSTIAMPMTILIIIMYGIVERKNVFDIFIKGAKEGIEMTIKILPTLIALFLAIGALRNSGILNLLINFLNPVLVQFGIPSEIMPLAMLRPISGSGSIAIATDIMKTYGVDSNIGLISSVIMGSTETTLYTIAVYSSSVGIKNTRFVLLAALAADITGMLVSIMVCRFLS